MIRLARPALILNRPRVIIPRAFASAMQQVLAAGGGAKSNVLISSAAGTNIGDMTNGGTLATLWDGNLTIGTNGASGGASWAGKTLASPKIFGQAEVYCSSAGYVNGSNPAGVILRARGKNGAVPTSETDGTIIGATASFTDVNATGMKTITSTDFSTAWDHIFIEFANPDTGQRGSGSEIVLYEWA